MSDLGHLLRNPKSTKIATGPSSNRDIQLCYDITTSTSIKTLPNLLFASKSLTGSGIALQCPQHVQCRYQLHAPGYIAPAPARRRLSHCEWTEHGRQPVSELFRSNCAYGRKRNWTIQRFIIIPEYASVSADLLRPKHSQSFV